jgi:hypothetical protein
MDGWRSADAAVDRAMDHGRRVHGGPGPRGIPRSDQAVGFAICGCGRTHATGGGVQPARSGAQWRLRRKFTGDGGLGARVHYLRRSLSREREEDVADLTKGSFTAVGRRRRRAAMRGGRDHGCSPGRGLRPRLHASGRRDVPLVYLCMQG